MENYGISFLKNVGPGKPYLETTSMNSGSGNCIVWYLGAQPLACLGIYHVAVVAVAAPAAQPGFRRLEAVDDFSGLLHSVGSSMHHGRGCPHDKSVLPSIFALAAWLSRASAQELVLMCLYLCIIWCFLFLV